MIRDTKGAILANWILKDLRPDLYFANKALGSTSIKALADPEISLFEAKYLIEKTEHKKAYDIGTLAHALILEGSLDHVVAEIPFENYRKKEAQELKSKAYAKGLIPVNLTERVDMLGDVEGMRDSVMAHPIASQFFSDHEPEVSVFWQRNGVHCKGRIDSLDRFHRLAVDLKTCVSARPNEVRKVISNLGYYIQAEHYLDGLRTVTGENYQWLFVFVQKSAPYTVSVHRLIPHVLEEARERIDYALERYKRALEFGWTGYEEIFDQDLTPWEQIKNEDLFDEMITV